MCKTRPVEDVSLEHNGVDIYRLFPPYIDLYIPIYTYIYIRGEEQFTRYKYTIYLNKNRT